MTVALTLYIDEFAISWTHFSQSCIESYVNNRGTKIGTFTIRQDGLRVQDCLTGTTEPKNLTKVKRPARYFAVSRQQDPEVTDSTQAEQELLHSGFYSALEKAHSNSDVKRTAIDSNALDSSHDQDLHSKVKRAKSMASESAKSDKHQRLVNSQSRTKLEQNTTARQIDLLDAAAEFDPQGPSSVNITKVDDNNEVNEPNLKKESLANGTADEFDSVALQAKEISAAKELSSAQTQADQLEDQRKQKRREWAFLNPLSCAKFNVLQQSQISELSRWV